MWSKILAVCLVLMSATLAYGSQREWVRFASDEWRCSVLMPHQPELSTQEATAATGEKFPQYLAKASDADSWYAVSYFDITSGMTFSLDMGRDGMLAAVNGTLLSEKAIHLGWYPGREVLVAAKNDGTDLLFRARFYNFGSRVYVLTQMVAKASDSAAMAEKAAKFFDSFRVTAGK